MSDTETNEPDEYYERENEKISITRAEARKFHEAYGKSFRTGERLGELHSDYVKLYKRVEKLEANATSLKGRVSALFWGLIVLALFQAGYLGS